MIYLSVAVFLLAVLCGLNLLLTLGLLRKAREGGLSPAPSPAGHVRAQGLTLGHRPPPFSVRTLDGKELTAADLAGGPLLVGFFSPGCRPCAEQAPRFTALAARWPGGPDRVLVVIADDDERAVDYAQPFEGLARRVIDGVSGPLATAYGVSAFPAFGLLDEDGTVVAEATTVDSLPVHVPAAA